MPASAGPPRLGASPFRRTDPDGGFAALPMRWDLADRETHRHGWFAAAALADRGEGAAAALEAWLRHDVPGVGIAWEHGTDLTARLVHWHAGLAWMASGERLRAGLAGSVSWHLRRLEATLPGDDHRRAAHFAGMVVGGFTFPDAFEARPARSAGLSGLGLTLPRVCGSDGVAAAPLFLAQTLWLAAIARAVARANGAAFPSDAEAALARGAHFLDRLTGYSRGLPPLGEAPFGAILACDEPIGPALAEIMGVRDEPGVASPTRVRWLGGVPSLPVPDAGKNWRMWAFREGGAVVAHQRIKGEPGRVVVRDRMQIACDIGGIDVLGEGVPSWVRSRGTIAVARVDGKKARIEGGGPGWERDVLLNQARIVVSDRAHVETRYEVRWKLGAGWEIEGAPPNCTAKNGKLVLVVQLSPLVNWRVEEGPVFVGEGTVEVGKGVGASFEVR